MLYIVTTFITVFIASTIFTIDFQFAISKYFKSVFKWKIPLA